LVVEHPAHVHPGVDEVEPELEEVLVEAVQAVDGRGVVRGLGPESGADALPAGFFHPLLAGRGCFVGDAPRRPFPLERALGVAAVERKLRAGDLVHAAEPRDNLLADPRRPRNLLIPDVDRYLEYHFQHLTRRRPVRERASYVAAERPQLVLRDALADQGEEADAVG